MAKMKWWATLMCLGCSLLAAGQEGGQPGRNIVVAYDILDYTNDIGNSIRTLLAEVVRPGDQLIIVAPTKNMEFSKDTLSAQKDQLADKINDTLKRDAGIAAANYNATFADMKSVVESITGAETGGDIRSLLIRYVADREQMLIHRRVNQKLLMAIAALFKAQAGENVLVILFEKGYRPIPSNEVLDRLRQNRDLAFGASDAFLQEETKKIFMEDDVIQAMTEARAMVHYIHYTPKSPAKGLHYRITEDTGYFHNFYRKLAKKTKGASEATGKPEAIFRKIL